MEYFPSRLHVKYFWATIMPAIPFENSLYTIIFLPQIKLAFSSVLVNIFVGFSQIFHFLYIHIFLKWFI